MSDINQFNYTNSDALSGVSTLDAYMSSFSYSRHTHQEYSFGATCKGEQHFSCGGEYHRSLAGNVIVFNPDEAHDGQSGGDGPLVYSMLYINPERMIPLLQAANISASNDYRFDDAIINDPTLHHQILSFSALLRNGSDFNTQQEPALFDIALTLAKHSHAHDHKAKPRAGDWRLGRIKEYIHASQGTDITLDGLAKIAGYSKYHFLRYFRNQTDITPWQYIINYRVNQARIAIENGEELADIIFDLGFSDQSHLNRQFKSIYGITPKKWQRNQQAAK